MEEKEIVEQPVKKKRGRKPSKDKFYFGEKQEIAVLTYLEASKIGDESTMNYLYNEILRPAFTKMVESIMRRYKLYVPNEETGQTFNDTLSFLITKMDKFETEKDKKAYSYYGNICKNYIIGKIQTYNKSLVRNPSYDSDETEIDIINDNRYAIKTDKGSKIASEIVEKLISRFNEMTSDAEKYDLRENEVKLGKALANLLDNWDYVISTDGSNKLNKNAILFFLREQTGLDTKGIRDNMKKFKKEFLIIKKYVIG